MIEHPLRRVGRGAWIAGLWLLTIAPTRAQDPVVSRAAELTFRRHYAPEDKIADWPARDTRYVPMEAQEFERIVQLLSSGSRPDRLSKSNGIEQAQYEARWNAQGWLDGQARWKVLHTGTSPSLISLEPGNLHIRRAEWDDDPESAAQIGLDAEGRFSLLADRSGSVDFEWSAAALRQNSGEWEVDLAFPRAASSTLDLLLPVEMSVRAEGGVIVSVEETEPGLNRWKLELGTKSHLRLALPLVNEISERRRLVLATHNLTYELTRRGLELVLQLRMNVFQEPLRQLEIELDPGLTLVSARHREVPLAWKAGSPGPDGGTKITIDFPQPLLGVDHALRFVAVAEGTWDQPAELPRITVSPVRWQEGTINLLVPEPMELQSLSTRECQQINTGPLPAPFTGEMLEFQMLSEQARLSVKVARRERATQWVQGTDVELTSTDLTATFRAEFDQFNGTTPSLSAEILPRWRVTSVAMFPPEVMADWSLEEDPNGSSRLLVMLAGSAAAKGPIQLEVKCQAASTEIPSTIAVSQVQPVRLVGPERNSRLLMIRSSGPRQLKLPWSDRVEMLQDSNLTAAEKRIFSATPKGAIYRVSESAEELRLQVQTEPVEFTAFHRQVVTVGPRRYVEKYSIEVRPRNAVLSEFVVCFTSRRNTPPRWRGDISLSKNIEARALSPEVAALRGIPEDCEAWLISLPRGVEVPFVIQADRQIDWSEPVSVSLASTPDAASQHGSVEVRTESGTQIEVHNDRLPRSTIVPNDEAGLPPLAGAFYYDPARELTEDSPALSVRHPQTRQTPLAWAWSAQLQAKLFPSGRALYLLKLRLENHGQDALTLTLPPSAQFLRAKIDGMSISPEVVEGTIRLPLKGITGRPTIEVEFLNESTPGWLFQEWQPEDVQLDVPVLSSEFVAWLPPDSDVYSTSSLPTDSHHAELALRQRLFWPLGRSPSATAAFVRSGQREEASQERSREILEFAIRSQQVAIEAGRAPLTWRDSVRSWQSALEEHGLTLWIDRHALAKSGIDPSTVIAKTADEIPESGAWDQPGIVILAHPAGVFVSSAREIARYSPELQFKPQTNAAIVQPGELWHSLQDAISTGSTQFIRGTDWIERPGSAQDLDRLSESFETDFSHGRLANWTRIAWVEPQFPIRLILVDRTFIWGIGCGTFLLVLAILRWTWPTWPVASLFLVWGCLVANLFLPTALLPVSSGGAWAGILFLAFALVKGGILSELKKARSVPHLESSALVRAGASLTILCVLLAAATALAQQPEGTKTAPTSDAANGKQRTQEDAGAEQPSTVKQYRVFIPVDQDKKPTGGRYLIPEEFKEELLRRASIMTGEPRGALLTAANYRLHLARERGDWELVRPFIQGRFEANVLTASNRVAIPLSRTEISPDLDRVLVDGIPSSARWDEAGKHLIVQVFDSGPCRIEFSFRPIRQETQRTSFLQFAVPPTPASTVEVSSPVAVDGLQVAGAHGLTPWSEEARQWQGSLDPRAELNIRWSEAQGSTVTKTGLEIEQLDWLRMRSGSVVLETQFIIRGTAGDAATLDLDVDRRLQILPLDQQSGVVREISTVSDAENRSELSRRTSLQLRPGQSGIQVVRLSASLIGSSAVGNFQIPWIHCTQGEVKRRLLALSVDFGMQATLQYDPAPIPIAPEEFARLWGPGSELPQQVFVHDNNAAGWSLKTRPLAATTRVNQRTAVLVSSTRALVHYEAEIETSGASVFQHLIRVPTGMTVRDLSLLEQNTQKISHWELSADGALQVFLKSPVSGRHQLFLDGEFPLQLNGEFGSPHLTLADAELVSDVLDVYREGEVKVDLISMTGYADAAEAASQIQLPWIPARLVKSLIATGAGPSARWSMAANQPRTKLDQFLLLESEGGQTFLELHGHLSVQHGALDQIRFQLPTSWPGPFTIDPPSLQPEVVSVAEAETHLVLRPQSSITGELNFVIRGPLNVPAGEVLRIPHVVPLRLDEVQTFWFLPSLAELVPIRWETSQLQAAPLPAELRAARVLEGELGEIMQVTGEHPTAEMSRDRPRANSGQITLASILLQFTSEGAGYGVAHYDLRPGGFSNFLIEVPPGCEITKCLVGGLPMEPASLENKQLAVPLQSNTLPQVVSILFQFTPVDPQGESAGAIPLPMPLEMSVEQTLIGARQMGPRSEILLSSGEVTTSLDAELLRLGSISSLASGVRFEDSAMDGPDQQNWHATWLAHWKSRHQEIEQTLAHSPAVDSNSSSIFENTLAESAKGIREFEKLSKLPNSASRQVVDPFDLDHFWERLAAPGAKVSWVRFPGYLERIEWRKLSTKKSPWTQAAWGVLASLLGLVLIGVRPMRLTLASFVNRWPGVIGAALGVFWWLWLWPSALGILLVVASLWFSSRHEAISPQYLGRA